MGGTLPEVIRPTWPDLLEVVTTANTDLLVCSPFYSAEGVGRIFDNHNEGASLRFWTRLSPTDWAGGFSYPDQLLALLDLLDGNGVDVALSISQRLHAKVYAADHVLALIGSANLTAGGFGSNLELAVRFRAEEAAVTIATLESICAPDLRPITLEQLGSWVDSSESTIAEARSVTVQEPEILAPVQAHLDEILNFGGAESPNIVEPEPSDMSDFAAWLANNTILPGAEALWRQHTNLDGNNRGGHFKQCFFASIRFFSEHPELLDPTSKVLDELSQGEIYQLDTPPTIGDSWREHVNAHATDSSSDYSYSTLRNILPPPLGGTVSGGGGGSGTIKRMLPLVARFVLENES